MRSRMVAVVLMAWACGPTAPPLDGSGSADDTGGDEDPSVSASAEDGAGPGGEVDGDPTIDPDDGADDFDDDGGIDSSGGAVQLCEHAPSGLAPGSVIWEVYTLGLIGGDVVATEYGITIAGAYLNLARIANVKGEGEVYWTNDWEQPGASRNDARQLVALPDGVVVAGIDSSVIDDPCAWCWERWLVAYDDDGQIQWELGLGFGAWAIAATPSGTIVVVGGSSSDDGVTFVETVLEVDAKGAVLRAVSGAPGAEGLVDVPRSAVVGADGSVVAVGTRRDDDGGWIGVWTSSYEFYWGNGGSSEYFGIALASNDDLIVPEGRSEASVSLRRQTFEGGAVWDVPMKAAPDDIAVDCNDDIVLAVGSVSRLDPNGAPLWETTLAGEPVAVAVDQDGDVVVLAQYGDELQIAELAGL